MNAAMSAGSSQVTPNSGVISAAVSGDRLHVAQGVDVADEPVVGLGGLDRLVELPDDVTGQVVGGELPLARRGAERRPRPSWTSATWWSTASWSAT